MRRSSSTSTGRTFDIVPKCTLHVLSILKQSREASEMVCGSHTVCRTFVRRSVQHGMWTPLPFSSFLCRLPPVFLPVASSTPAKHYHNEREGFGCGGGSAAGKQQTAGSYTCYRGYRKARTSIETQIIRKNLLLGIGHCLGLYDQ